MIPKEGSPQQPAVETQVERYSTQDFLEKLYATTLDWLVNDQKGKVIAEFEPQKISDWESYESDPGRVTRLDINLLKAVLVKNSENNFALVIGRRRRNKYAREETLGLQFGLRPVSEDKYPQRLSPINKLRTLRKLVGGSHYGKGEFYEHDMTRSIYVGCWADDYTFGGKWINRWGKDKLLTDNGIMACLKIVQKTAKNAFL